MVPNRQRFLEGRNDAVVVKGDDEAGAALTITVKAKSQPDAARSMVALAAERAEKSLDIPRERDRDSSRRRTRSGGPQSFSIPSKSSARRCAKSNKTIAYEPDARVCTRCERVYHKCSLPKKCVCGQDLAELRHLAPDDTATIDDDAADGDDPTRIRGEVRRRTRRRDEASAHDETEKPGFDGQNVLVTGASRGVGAACAVFSGRSAATLPCTTTSIARPAQAIAHAVRDGGGSRKAIAANLSVWGEGELLVGAAEDAARTLDVVVVNHGIWKGAPIDSMSGAEYDEMIDANVRGAFSVTGAAVRRMKARKKGRIILIASTAGQRGEADHSHYAASKGALISLTKSLASELAGDGILVNCVAPGWVDAMERARLVTTHEPPRRARGVPLGRVATPEEIAGPVVFLASEHATFITGEILNVNGGAVLVG